MAASRADRCPPASRANLESLLSGELARPLPAQITALAEATRARHGQVVAAVLAYGSCLRDGVLADRIVDLYLLVDSYRTFHRHWLLRWANVLLPPNVYYLEIPFQGETLRAKYAVVSLADFARLTTPRAFHPYFWARFAQPCALAYAREDAVRQSVIDALPGGGNWCRSP